MDANEFGRLLRKTNPDRTLLKQLDEKLSAAQKRALSLDDEPLVSSQPHAQKTDGPCGLEGFPPKRLDRIVRRGGCSRSRWKAYGSVAAALLVIAGIGAFSFNLGRLEELGLRDVAPHNDYSGQDASSSFFSADPSESSGSIGVVEISAVDLVWAKEKKVVLEAVVSINSPACATDPVSLSIEDGEAAKSLTATVTARSDASFSIRETLSASSVDADALDGPIQRVVAFVQGIQNDTFMIKSKSGVMRARLDLEDLDTEALIEFVTTSYEENDGVVAIELAPM